MTNLVDLLVGVIQFSLEFEWLGLNEAIFT